MRLTSRAVLLLCVLLSAGSWLPGWSKYIRACERLDSTINSILQETRTQQQQQQQQQASCTGGAEHSPGSTSAAPPSSSSSSRQTLVSFLLAAQQQQGADQIPDQQILDEIKTVMFGGVDTSAFTLAVCAHFLAQHPAAADRAAAEVAALLRGSGRSSVGQLRAGDASKLPWVLACVNETMRLVPAGPAITRTALQV
jgi:cytochrome P450